MSTPNTTNGKELTSLTPYLQADSEAKEVIEAIPSISPALPNYGGKRIARALVLVQMYQTNRKESKGTGIYTFKQVPKRGEDGKPQYEMKPVLDEEGQPKFDALTKQPYMERVPIFEEKKKLVQVRQHGGKHTVSTLNVVPIRIEASENEMNAVIGGAFDDLQRAITTGRPVKMKRNINGEAKEVTVHVKNAFRKNALVHVFFREGDKVISTVQMLGGVKGSVMYNDFHQFCKDVYRQLLAAKAQQDGKPLDVDTSILTALGLTSKK